MEENKFEFCGVDFRTELLIGLMTGFIFVVMWFGALFLYYQYFELDSILRISRRTFFLCMISSLLVSMLLLRGLGNKYKSVWTILDHQNQLTVIFKNQIWKFEKSEIQKINYIGNKSFRYLSFFFNKQNIKIRVGTGFLTPFSKKIDIEAVERFIVYISPFLLRYFNNRISKAVFFENQGMYVKNNLK